MDQYGPYIVRNCARCGKPILVGPSIYLIIWLAIMVAVAAIGYLLL
jgi:hypothetical protein